MGLDAQERDIRLLLQGFSDALAGSDDERHELAKALELVRETGAELLLAKLDRLSRKMSFIAPLMDDPKLKLRGTRP